MQEELAEIVWQVLTGPKKLSWYEGHKIIVDQETALDIAKAIRDRGYVAPVSAELIYQWLQEGDPEVLVSRGGLKHLAQALQEAPDKAWVERVFETLKGYQKGHAELTSYLPQTDEDVKPCTCPLCEEADRLLTGDGE